MISKINGQLKNDAIRLESRLQLNSGAKTYSWFLDNKVDLKEVKFEIK